MSLSHPSHRLVGQYRMQPSALIYGSDEHLHLSGSLAQSEQLGASDLGAKLVLVA